MEASLKPRVCLPAEGKTKGLILTATPRTAGPLQPNEIAFLPVIPTQARDMPPSAL